MPADPHPTSRLTAILDDDETRLKAKIRKLREEHKAADTACDLNGALKAETAMNRALDRLAALIPRQTVRLARCLDCGQQQHPGCCAGCGDCSWCRETSA